MTRLSILLTIAIGVAACGEPELTATDAALPPETCQPAADPVETYFLAWNTGNAVLRRCLLDSIWSERGRYVDPQDDVTGIDALSDTIGGILNGLPVGATIVLTGPVVSHHDVVQFPWAIKGGDTVVLPGMDFGRLDDGHKLTRIVGFFEGNEESVTGPLAELAAAMKEADSTERDIRLHAATTDEVRFVGPADGTENDHRGRGALDTFIRDSLENGLRIELAQTMNTHGEFVRFRWSLIDGGGNRLASGVGIGELAGEPLRFREIVVFSTP